eukprot:CAMPEP_0196718700 /NCGR_PEP_ID=MMETSP1091-20130531/1841_1 /TAXON_ID=302021 /ORGANISM="Rhodomonas sp., Strain CCMP768" /LENGTH=235 /DNA_ID=CAMNT_0042059427 /DNA_START=107 /DNA_END=814 /DNA_ORIENTATION=+
MKEETRRRNQPRQTPQTDEIQPEERRRQRRGLIGTAFRVVFAVPIAFLSAASAAKRVSVRAVNGIGNGASALVTTVSASLEAEVAVKLYTGFKELSSGFAELFALGATMTLLSWVSGLFLGLALASVGVALVCLYVLGAALGMNWMLDRVRYYLRDCLLLRVCSFAIPVVSVLKNVRTAAGVTVHFPEESMVWVLHAGSWVVRLCWHHCWRPLRYLRGPPPKRDPDTAAQAPGGG